jgi:glycine/D-amino acid oxidase-like deaminating enzyme
VSAGVKALVAESLARASSTPYWLDDPERPAALPALGAMQGPDSADLVVVGGGYFGLWTALLAKERDPDREVLLLEGATCGHAASGRNGGFCEASLTHGFGNGLSRWPDELQQLIAMGRENLDGIERTVHEHGIDCDFVRAGSFGVATQDYQVDPLREEYDETRSHGMATTWLSGPELRERVDSPTFLAGMHDPDAAILEPARLAWGLRDACLRSGVRIAEQTQVTSLARAGDGIAVHTGDGRVQAQRVVLATNAYPPLLRRLRLMTVPVYDYPLMT